MGDSILSLRASPGHSTFTWKEFYGLPNQDVPHIDTLLQLYSIHKHTSLGG